MVCTDHKRMSAWLVTQVSVLFYVGCLQYGTADDHYINKWAVHVPGGDTEADQLAHDHGFHNEGQVGDLDGYYVFSHNHVGRRSVDPSPEHHQKLADDQRVSWTEQQVNRIRKKRDFVEQSKHDLHFIDPLWKDQWYLNGGAVGGFDMNVLPVWKKGITGRGVVVSILDDGIERNHTDLVNNYSPEASWDINGNDNDPMPRYDSYDENRHGTRCAGEVAAQANNSKCAIGIAYNARVGGVRMLDGGVSDYVEAKALSLNPQVIDIYSASWGPDDNGKVVDGPASLAKQAFINGVLKGRGGKGSIFVWASGNGGSQFDSCNCDGYTNSIFTLSTSSVSEKGRRPWYLEECSSTLATTYSSGENFNDQKIVTTDLHDRCTAAHTGTSASAPLAAGMCALALEANPSLTWRDMQYIVMMTSRTEPLLDGEWATNGAGRKVSHRYGYGVMDAAAMVDLAEKWRTVPRQHICTSNTVLLNQEIGPDGLIVAIDTDGCAGQSNEVRYLEHVQAKVTMTYSQRGDIRLTLISPNGTRSLLLAKRKKDTEEGDFVDWPFMSVHFWEENPRGQWKLEIENTGGDNNHGEFVQWQLIIYGVDTYPMRLREPGKDYTDDTSQFLSNAEEDDMANYLGNPSDHVTNYIDIDGGKNIFLESDHELTDNGWSIGMDRDGMYIDGPPPGMLDGDANMSDQEDWYSWFHGITNNGRERHCHIQCAPGSDCSGPHPEDCETCNNYRIGTSGPCVSHCPTGSYIDNMSGSCLLCTPPCEFCLESEMTTCLACIDGFYLLQDQAECVQSCPIGTYYDDAGICVACPTYCLSCTRDNMCVECAPGYTIDDGKCSTPCLQQYYEADAETCDPCHMSCSDCFGPSSYQCLSCAEEYVFQNSSCLSECSDGYYLNSPENNCLKCSLGCAECSSAFQCLQCLGSLQLQNGKCANSCSHGEYLDSTGCVECDITCDTCIGSSEFDCLSCSSNRYLLSGQCTTDCPVGYFMPDEGSTVDIICLECHHTCMECAGVQNDQCTSCRVGTHLVHGECRPLCTQSEYYASSQCLSCHASCLRCNEAGPHGCTACISSHYLSPNGMCVDMCPLMYYPSNAGVCTKCSEDCERCSGPAQCSLCVGGYILTNGVCLSPSPENSNCLHGQYLDPISMECEQCDTHCESCTGSGPKQCITCIPPYHLQTDLHRCVLCCTDAHRHGCCNCHPTTGVCMEDRNIDDPYDFFMVTSGSSDLSISQSHISLSNLGEFASTRQGFVAVVIFFCVFSVVVFFVIFGVLQARTRGRNCWPLQSGQRYHAVPTYYQKSKEKVLLTTEDFEDEDECFTA